MDKTQALPQLPRGHVFFWPSPRMALLQCYLEGVCVSYSRYRIPGGAGFDRQLSRGNLEGGFLMMATGQMLETGKQNK